MQASFSLANVLAGSYLATAALPCHKRYVGFTAYRHQSVKNIGRMPEPAWFLHYCLPHLCCMGHVYGGSGTVPDVTSILSRAFRLSGSRSHLPFW